MLKHLLSFILPFFMVSHCSLFAQKVNSSYRLHIKKTTSPVKVDGIMDDQAWSKADVATDFYMILPTDTSYAKVHTDVRMTYDQKNLYLFVTNHHGVPGPYMVESLRRDFSFTKNDNFLLFMDPFDDQTNGFSFGANAAGAQWDGLMYDGGSVDLSWDNKWISAVKNYEDKWTFEAAIPFKTIRYKKGIKEWGINFGRNDLKTTEKSSWAPVPRQFPSASLAYTGTLVWDETPPSTGSNISLIPYVLAGGSKDFNGEDGVNKRSEVGLDAKIGLGSSLNLDLTINPDFSQVEVDRQVTNLDRFELFFPERRQFFLENADIVAGFGYENIRPFFSRRIGLNAPIDFGARLSGNIGDDWRINAMSMQTGKVNEIGLPAQNFSVIGIQKRVFSRSNIRAIFVNKELLNYSPDPSSEHQPYNQFNRNLGLEYNLASANNIWTGKAMVLKSFSPNESQQNLIHAANLQYASGNLNFNWRHEYISENYQAEVGYIPRTGYYKVNPSIGYLFFGKSKYILNHGPQLSTSIFFNKNWEKTENSTLLEYMLRFHSQSTLTIWAGHDYVNLQQPFDPTNFSGIELAAGTQHEWYRWGAKFNSKPQSLFTYALSYRTGGYYADGAMTNYAAEMGYRFQPYVGISLNATYNDLELPEQWGDTKFWLVGPRLDVTLTNKVFFTAFAQYNEQMDNLNLNGRFQWRFSPASDLFLVYTDNYIPYPVQVQNRALLLKLTYWWNL
ncbi:MAG: DUF5916 domain-containing protein [Salegentibacter sp.]|uniref:carbohydrate binding family 9 domain-containing protein n=1 Tax=Salegentibacter sp. TaxID=1903072 RepID=UPI0028702B6E|nr:DUF5916 domain-containing protein [Salegentibacter sp.]MDR9456986.1 DUF5916 domain-containing protein [Salegentibacter sp.]